MTPSNKRPPFGYAPDARQSNLDDNGDEKDGAR
jgi:hypothetical protein